MMCRKPSLNLDVYLSRAGTCPDLQSVCALVAEDKLIDTAYSSLSGPITPMDMLYGHRQAMASGNLYMAQRCGFTRSLLTAVLRAIGFRSLYATHRPNPFYDLWVIAKLDAIDETEIIKLAADVLPN